MSIQRILVPLDGSPLAEGALVHAERLAKTFDAQVFLLHVLEALPAIAEQCAESVDWRLRRLEAGTYLKTLAERLAQAGVHAEYHVSEGRAADEITSFARDTTIDLTVLNAYGWGGISEFPFGGTVQKLLSARGLSCLVARPGAGDPEQPGYKRILVPLDGSQRAEWAANVAGALARQNDAELVLLQVIPVPDMPRRLPLTREETQLRDKFVECNRRAAAQYLVELAARLGNDARVRTRHVVSARIVPAIRQNADEENADLIVLTGHGVAGPNGVVQGSICNALLCYSNRPVLVLRDGSSAAESSDPRVDWAERKLCAIS